MDAAADLNVPHSNTGGFKCSCQFLNDEIWTHPCLGLLEYVVLHLDARFVGRVTGLAHGIFTVTETRSCLVTRMLLHFLSECTQRLQARRRKGFNDNSSWAIPIVKSVSVFMINAIVVLFSRWAGGGGWGMGWGME